MQLRYIIKYAYDYPTNCVIIVLTSPYMTKEYPVSSMGNMAAVLNQAIEDFNELHKAIIEELKNEEIIEKARKAKSSSQKSKQEQAEGGSE